MRMLAISFTVTLTILGAHAIAAPQSGRVAAGTIVYVGTYTGGKTNSHGIYAFRMQDRPGQAPSFTPLGLAAESTSPSFVTIDAVRGLLFAVNELDEYEGKPTGSIS